MDAETSIYALSAVSKLEPLSGFSLAINLAYLNLKRWRYREQVAQLAERSLNELEAKRNGHTAQLDKLDQLTGLKVLAGDTDPVSEHPTFIKVFHGVYGAEWDIWASVAFSIVAALILCVGVAHSIEFGAWLLPIAGHHACRWYFGLLVLSVAVPGGMVLFGRWLVKRSNTYAKYCGDQLASILEQKIDDVVVPVPPAAAGFHQPVQTQANSGLKPENGA